MLRKTTLLATFCATLTTLSQDPADLNYLLKGPTLLQECAADGTITNFSIKLVPGSCGFSVVKTLADDKAYVIKFWTWDGDPAQATRKDGTFDNNGNPDKMSDDDKTARFEKKPAGNEYELRYFRITASDLATFATVVQSRLQPIFGAATVPFKLRPQYGDISSDVALTGMGGASVLWSKRGTFRTGFLIGLGLSNVVLDSASTDGHEVAGGTRSGYTLATGLFAQWNNLQLGAFVGWDHLARMDRKTTGWIYHGAPWIAFGVGVTIFKEERAASSGGKN